MRLIIETLEESEDLQFQCTGADNVADPNLISLNFSVKKGFARGDINVRGMIDMPLNLSAQYDRHSIWPDLPLEQAKIDQLLRFTSAKVNRLL